MLKIINRHGHDKAGMRERSLPAIDFCPGKDTFPATKIDSLAAAFGSKWGRLSRTDGGKCGGVVGEGDSR